MWSNEEEEGIDYPNYSTMLSSYAGTFQKRMAQAKRRRAVRNTSRRVGNENTVRGTEETRGLVTTTMLNSQHHTTGQNNNASNAVHPATGLTRVVSFILLSVIFLFFFTWVSILVMFGLKIALGITNLSF